MINMGGEVGSSVGAQNVLPLVQREWNQGIHVHVYCTRIIMAIIRRAD